MESRDKYLFLSRSLHSDWFVSLCVSIVRSCLLLRVPSRRLFLCWFPSFTAARLFPMEGSLARGCPKIYFLWLLPARTDSHSDPKFENSWNGIWLTCCGSDTHPWATGLRSGGQRHESLAQQWESYKAFDPSRQPTGERPSDLVLLFRVTRNAEVHHSSMHSKRITYYM